MYVYVYLLLTYNCNVLRKAGVTSKGLHIHSVESAHAVTVN